MKTRTAIILFWLFNVFNLIDIISTIAVIEMFPDIVYEGNPIANYFLQISPFLFAGFKIFICVTCGYVLYKYRRYRSAKIALIGSNVLYSLIILWHSYVWYSLLPIM